jgi:CsoR family transcriptional regulator, copper-sensing transcriptional repressor
MEEIAETPENGYTPTKGQLLKRLRRIEGQVRGVAKMVEDDRYCIDVLTQISAVQAAMDRVALGLMDEHVRHCVINAQPGQQDAKAEELMSAVGRLLRSR